MSTCSNDGVCFQVERDLGSLVRNHQSHMGPQADTSLSDVLLVYLDGPSSRTELLSSPVLSMQERLRVVDSDDTSLGGLVDKLLTHEARPGNGYELELTPFTEACTREWIRGHGRRFNVYPPSAKSTVRLGPTRGGKRKLGGDAAVRRNQAKALDSRVKAASEPGATHRYRSLFGSPLDVSSKKRLCPPPSDKEKASVKKFKETTTKKTADHLKQQQLRRSGLNPYPLMPSRCGRMFKKPTPADAARAKAKAKAKFSRRPSTVRCLNLSNQIIMEKGPCYSIINPPASAKDLTRMNLVIVKSSSLTVFDNIITDDAHVLQALLVLVAFGLTVISFEAWQSERDPLHIDKVSAQCPKSGACADADHVDPLLRCESQDGHKVF